MLILKDNVTSLSPFVLAMLDPALVSPWQFLGDWFQGSELTPFEKAQRKGFWDYCNQSPEYNNIFINEGMASDSRLMSLVVKDYQPIFEGLGSLVDVGVGTGTVARIISQAFPHMKCTCLTSHMLLPTCQIVKIWNLLVAICFSISLLQMPFCLRYVTY